MSSLIKFVSKDGMEHIGWYSPYRTPMYCDIYGRDYEEIEASSEVQTSEFLYWDSEKETYLSLPWPLANEEDKKEWNSVFVIKGLVEDYRSAEMGLRQMIREWLLLHAKCPSRVYIEKDFSIRSEQPIMIDESQSLPEFIHFI